MTSIRWPAEWETQAAVWLAWPHNRDTWPGSDTQRLHSRADAATRFHRIPPFFDRWARLIAEDTPVRILGQATDTVSRGLRGNNIEWIDVPTNDCWIRDYGPTFVFHRDTDPSFQESLRAIDWRYNAWGEKYPPWDHDQAAAKQIARHLDLPVDCENVCLEGGALETDGDGRLLTTTSSIVTPNRNPDLTIGEIESRLRVRLGLREVVWLDGHLAGDDTDGHIDQLARFIDPANIVVAACDDGRDANFAPLQHLRRQLQRWTEQTHPRPLLHALPIPPPRYIDGRRVPESYCNFLWLGRERLLVPTFGHRPSDERAIAILGELAVGTDVIGIDCRDLVWGLGALHCASREQPGASREQPGASREQPGASREQPGSPASR